MSDLFSSLPNDSFGGVLQAKVLFDFTPRAFNQISLKVGQVIKITTYGGPGSWSQGAEVGTGKVGFFPSDYAQLLPNGEKQAASPPAPSPLVPVVSNIKTIKKLMEKKAVNDFPGSGVKTLEVLEKVSEGAWAKGLHGDFPSDFIEFTSATSSHDNNSTLPPKEKEQGLRTAESLTSVDPCRVRVGDTYEGILVRLIAGKKYGFISAIMGTVFFPPREFGKQKFVVGSTIEFILSENSKGFVASNCRLIEVRLSWKLLSHKPEFEGESTTSTSGSSEDLNGRGFYVPLAIMESIPAVDPVPGSLLSGDNSSQNTANSDEQQKVPSLVRFHSMCSSDSSMGESTCRSSPDQPQADAGHGDIIADPATYLSTPTMDIAPEDIEAFATFTRQYRAMMASPLSSIAMELTKSFIQQQKDTFPADLLSNTRKGDAAFAEQIIQNYKRAFDSMIASYCDGVHCITKEFMKKLHYDICRDVCATAGKFRSKPVRVGTQRFVKVAQVEKAVNEFCAEINGPGDCRKVDHSDCSSAAAGQTLSSSSSSGATIHLNSLFAAAHPCVQAAYVAYRLCYIHPFEDGNGRTARLLANFILTSEVPFPISYCSTPTDRKKYIMAFRSKSSPAMLASHFMDCVLRAWRKFHVQFTDIVIDVTLKTSSPLQSINSSSSSSLKAALLGLMAGTSDDLAPLSSKQSENDGAEKSDSESHLIMHKARALLRLENCVICFEKDSDLSLLCCGRPFHAHCIFQWMAASQSRVEDGQLQAHCPQCRHAIDMQDLRIYTNTTKQDMSEEEEEEEDTSDAYSEDISNTTTSDSENDSDEGTPICRRCSNIRSRECINKCCGRCCGDSYLDLPCLKHSKY